MQLFLIFLGKITQSQGRELIQMFLKSPSMRINFKDGPKEFDAKFVSLVDSDASNLLNLTFKPRMYPFGWISWPITKLCFGRPSCWTFGQDF